MTILIEKLTRLAEQRTARTDRLFEITQALLARLSNIVKVGDSVTVDGYELARVRVRSNVGASDCWTFGSERTQRFVYLDKGLNFDGFLHGDFGCKIAGPSRADLVEFGRRIEKFVAAFVQKYEAQCTELQDATDALEHAGQRLG